MIVPISINLQDFEQFSLSKKETEDVVDFTIKQITSAFANRWEEVARNDLHSTRKRYIDNLLVIDEGRMTGSVLLDYSKDPLVKMIEEGCSAFDMKLNYAKSAKRVIKKNGTGWYLTVPFKAGTPDAIGDTAGFSFNMPTEVYNTIKNKPVDSSGTATLKKSEVPTQFAAPKSRLAMSSIPTSKTFEEYKHKASIYSGIVKTQDSVTGQNSYNSFRRVSDKSDGDSWIYPGLPQLNLCEKAYGVFESTLDTELTKAIDAALDNAGL